MGNEKRIRNGRRLFAVLSAVVLAVSALLGRYGLQAYAAGAHTLTHYDTRYNDGLLRVGYFEIDNGTVAMCVCHEMDPPTAVGTALSTVASYTAENQGNELLRKIYYYGWNGPADIGASFVETCLAGSVANGHEDNYYGYGQAFIQKISVRPAAPKGFSVYLLSSGDSTKQTLAYWDYHPTGYVALTKGTEYTAVVKGNHCYSLEGAQYGVYSDASCTKRAAVLTTGAGGKTNTAELDAGKYYVKEIKVPAGYQLDKEVYPVTVEPQETAEVSVKDVPVWEDMELAVHKKDAETEKGLPQGGASLAGAQFTVNFYAGYYGADNLPVKPDRSWVLETKKDGEDGKASYQCRLNKDHLVSGDPLFEVNGKTVLPLGTVTVTETKAPEGYVSEGVIFTNGTKEWSGQLLAQVKQDVDSAGLSGGNEYAALEQVIRGDLEFVKVSDGKQERLADIPFRITSKATGESHVIVTDRNGYASTASGWNPHTQNCENVNPDLQYTSKATIVAEFDEHKNMYAMVGSLLSFILAMIGILNFINTMVTSVLSRKQEFAMMEAVGMTGEQLKQMLCYEGGYYAVFTSISALLLAGILDATAVRMFGEGFFFFTWHFTVMPVILCIPVLAVVVYLIPLFCYRSMSKVSVVERMRRAE